MELILGFTIGKNDWKTTNKKPVKNKELWVELDQLVQKHKISWNWVKGHSGDPVMKEQMS